MWWRKGESSRGGGHRELVVTGVNVGTYRFEEFTVVDVVRQLSAIDGVDRVRVSSIEPTTVPDELVEWMATSEKACRHLHLPLQSGDDGVLARMRRVYDTGEFERFVERAVERMPELGLGTDVIVGFPGETDREFERTVAFVESMPFTYLHVFAYSDRPKTVADGLDGKVHSKVVKERSARLRWIARQKRGAFLRRHVGREVEVLFESVDSDGLRKGWTGSYARVGVDPEAFRENELGSLRIVEAAEDFCLGASTYVAAGSGGER